MGKLREILDQPSDWHAAMSPLWKRYAAFGGNLNTAEQKKEWLPKGAREFDDDYNQRLALTKDLGWTAPAIRRVAGTLSRQQATRQYTTSELSADVIEKLGEFDERADGASDTIDRWFGSTLPKVLRYGLVGVEIARDSVDGAATAADESLPYLTCWLPSEILWVELDARGVPLWAKMSREVTSQPDHMSPPVKKRIWRILTRTEGMEYEVILDPNRPEEDPRESRRWQHNLGVVPIVPFYATKVGPWRGWSYVHAISDGDARLLQLESDQSMSSYMHGSPQLVLKTKRDLAEIAADTSSFLKLNPDENEDASYLALDVTGMGAREIIIERTSRQALNAAGIDPSAVSQGDGQSSRSGVSIAWQFSTSEEPTLSEFSNEMCTVDRAIHEVVARYVDSGTLPDAHTTHFDGTITRANKWDLMSVPDLIDGIDSAWSMVPSESWRRSASKVIASRIPGNNEPEDMAAINAELDAEKFEDAPPPMIPQIGEDGQPIGNRPPPFGEGDDSEDEQESDT